MAAKSKKKKKPASNAKRAAAPTPAKPQADEQTATKKDGGKAYTAPKGRATVHSAPASTAKSGRSGWSLVAAGVLVVAGILGYAMYEAVKGGGDGVTESTAFDLPALDSDGRVALANYAGKPLVVNFFASWCEQCDAELPDFTRVANEQEDNIDFLFVASNETGDWKPMAERHGLVGNFDLAKDIKGTNRNGLYRSLGGTGGMPMTAFYDSSGQVIDVSRGALVGPALEQRLRQLGLVT